MMKTIARNTLLPLVALVGFALGLMFMMTGCQTMKGAGKDIERAGEKIQENADNHN
jgi:predicted small secreted protein